jgi:hypothetical protein
MQKILMNFSQKHLMNIFSHAQTGEKNLLSWRMIDGNTFQNLVLGRQVIFVAYY